MPTYYAEGPYRAEIKEQGLSKSKNDNPQFFLKIVVLESLDINPISYQQYERTIFWTVTEKTIDFVVDKLATLGFQGASFRQLDPSHVGHQSFVGQEIEVYCKLETYEGKEREKWDLSFTGGGTQEPLDESEARKLDALFGRKLKDKFGSSAPVMAPLSFEPSEVEGNDDIAF